MPDDAKTQQVTAKAVEIFVNDKKISFDTDDVTGAQITAAAGVPADYSLYRREEGSNEPIGGTERVELEEGDHFFTRPPSNIS
jgi:hypothetical protein